MKEIIHSVMDWHNSKLLIYHVIDMTLVPYENDVFTSFPFLQSYYDFSLDCQDIMLDNINQIIYEYIFPAGSKKISISRLIE